MRMLAAVSSSCLLLSISASGQIIETQFENVPNGEFLGSSVSLEGDRGLVGAPGSKRVFVIERGFDETWTKVAELEPSVTLGSSFGQSVALDGDRALVGDQSNRIFGDGVAYGAAYIFERNASGQWVEIAKLRASDAAPGDNFGWSVSLEGDRALIGAAGDDHTVAEGGSAYIFERDASGNWIETEKLTASDPAQWDGVGGSVSLEGDRALVGTGGNAGFVCVFERDSTGAWIEDAKITNVEEQIGGAVSLDGGRALIGATSRAAYVYEKDASGDWIEVTRLSPSDHFFGNSFGNAVALDGGRVVVGARNDDENGSQSGAAYVFDEEADGRWTEVAKLTFSGGDVYDGFGSSVAVDGASVLVGGPYRNVNDWRTATGVASLFELGPPREIDVSPLAVDFGLVNVFQSSSQIITIENVGGLALALDSLTLTGDPSLGLAGAPSLPGFLGAGDVLDLTVSFEPTSVGTKTGTLEISSNDGDESSVIVTLIGEAVAGEPDEQCFALEEMIAASILDGSLVGIPSGNNGNNAEGRLGAFSNMVEAACDLIDTGLLEDACGPLRSALRRIDGEDRPPDFVTGESAGTIRSMIAFLLESLSCE